MTGDAPSPPIGGAPCPRISCLVPVYNGEQFLAEALDSILAQTFADFELVVVDDGSSDGTAAILADYAARDARVRVIRRTNGGIVAALNTGLAECRGVYIARMDADDVAVPERFAFQSAYLDAHPGCVIVGGIATSVHPDGTKAGNTTGGHHARTDLSVFPPKVAVSIHPLITIRRDALVAVGGYRGDFPHAEDYDLFIRLARFGTIDNPDRVMLLYRRHENALSLRHLESQEVSAARSELEAIAGAGYQPVPEWLFESYTRLRIWRRYLPINPPKAKALTGRIVQDLLTLRPRTLFSRRYWRLRAIIFANLARSTRRTLSSKSR